MLPVACSAVVGSCDAYGSDPSAFGRGFRVPGSGCRVHGSGFRVSGSGFWVLGSGCRVQGSGIRVQGSRFRVRGSGFRMQGSGFGVSSRTLTLPSPVSFSATPSVGPLSCKLGTYKTVKARFWPRQVKVLETFYIVPSALGSGLDQSICLAQARAQLTEFVRERRWLAP